MESEQKGKPVSSVKQIASIIKSVLSCFFPSLNFDKLKLPGERCAGYMRREELKTVSMAQKACTLVECDSVCLNLMAQQNARRKSMVWL